MKSLVLLLAFPLVNALIYLEINNNKDSSENKVDLKINRPLSTDRFTVCVAFRIESSFEYGSIFKDENVMHELFLHARGSYGVFNWLGYSFLFEIPSNAIGLFTWTNFCITFNETHYFTVASGKVWSNLHRVSGSLLENNTESKMQTISFGPCILGTLKVTNLNVWSDHFSIDELIEYTGNCKPIDTTQLILDWSRLGRGNFSNMNGNIKFEEIKRSLCNHNTMGYSLFTLKEHLLLEKAIKTCATLGGRVALPLDQDDLEEDSQLLSQTPQCSRFWLPLHKNPETFEWYDHYHIRKKLFLPWAKLEPNGRDVQLCAVLHKGFFHDVSCNIPSCFQCFLEEIIQFKLRGLDFKTIIDDHYILRQKENTFNGMPAFHGISRGSIIYDHFTKSWMIYDHYHIPTSDALIPEKILGIHKVSEGSVNLPIGLKEWNIIGPSRNLTKRLKLTMCGIDKYTCFNGECIDMYYICDGFYDCSDQSDEEECTWISVNNKTYQSHLPPMERGQKTQIKASFDIQSFEDINVLQMKFKSKFVMSLQWNEPRVHYHYLQRKVNYWTKAAKQLWKPNLHFSNSVNAIDVLSNPNINILILKMGKLERSSDQSLHEIYFSHGHENDMVLQAVYDLEFKCTYNLENYPFDTQKCFIELDIGLDQINYLELTKGNLTFSGHEDQFVQFHVSHFKLIQLENGRFLKCTFIFDRIPFFYLFITFFPTFGIVVMSLITLFINEKHFDSTIMVSLTSMLVLYTLHQSIMAQMPATAYLKFMDYWLIFCLTIPFIVFLILVSWNLMNELNEDNVQTLEKFESFNKRKHQCKKTIQIGLPLISIICVLGFAIYAIILES